MDVAVKQSAAVDSTSFKDRLASFRIGSNRRALGECEIGQPNSSRRLRFASLATTLWFQYAHVLFRHFVCHGRLQELYGSRPRHSGRQLYLHIGRPTDRRPIRSETYHAVDDPSHGRCSRTGRHLLPLWVLE